MTLTILNSTGQEFCRIFLGWGFSDIFFMIRLNLWILGNNIIEVKYPFYRITSEVHYINITYYRR